MAEKKKQGGVNHLYKLLYQYEDEGEKAYTLPRVTNEHSTGDMLMDEYLGGGYGRPNAYEIVMIFGDTGSNKSTLSTQLILNPALKGKQIAIFALEDDVVDVYTRIRRQSLSFGAGKFDDPMVAMRKISKSIWMAPDSDGYTLEAMALEIESLFTTGTDIVVVDPLQFIFEASVVEKTETEFNRQRLFMRQINNMMKRVARETGKSKTIILVSHTNKGRYESAMDNIMGSGANKQVPTKIIQVYRDKDGFKFIRLHKSRFTQHRFGSHPLELDPNTMTFHTIACPPDRSPEDWANEIRACWDRKGA